MSRPRGRFGRPFAAGITAKLLLVNLFVFLVFAAVVGVVSVSFERIERLLTTTVVRDVNENVQNAALLKDLSAVFADANLLASTFFKDEEVLADRAGRLIESTTALKRRSTNAALRASLEEFSGELRLLFDQCTDVNRMMRGAEREERDLEAKLGQVERAVSDTAVEQILAGEDSTFMEQLNVLISGYRETFLQINILFLRSTLDGARDGPVRSVGEVTSLIDDLSIRFRTITASEPRIAAYGPKLATSLAAYRRAVVQFFAGMDALDVRLAAMERSKSAVLSVMSQMDQQIASSTLSTRGRISDMMRDARVYMFLASVGMLVLLVGVTMLFIHSNLSKPMAALGSGIEAIRAGDLDTRIELHRRDEWSVIESALNRLAADLKASTTELRDKNKKLEITQRELHDQIEEVVSQSEARKRLQEQLRHAHKMEAIGTLAGGIAHDFNNILSVLIGCGGILRMEMREDDPLRSCVDDILSSSEKAAALTRDLLAFSRKQVIRPQPVQLNAVVKTVEKLLLRLIGEDIQLDTNLAEEELTVMADGSQLEQVLLNLATNARDAMPQGGRLVITTSRVDLDAELCRTALGDIEPGAYAVISLSDTGVGMDEATKARVFEPFFTTKGVGKGTGLGLSMAYGIVKQHRGEIEVHTTPGEGTTFRIYLKLTEASVEVEDGPAPTPRPLGGNETILVAEDDPGVRKLMGRVLTQFGYRVIEAVDGEDAIRKFVENMDAVTLVIVDVVMPRKNGKQASEEMRRMKPDVRVLFSSGYTADIMSQKGILEEGIHFVAKPVAPEVLLSKVREVLLA